MTVSVPCNSVQRSPLANSSAQGRSHGSIDTPAAWAMLGPTPVLGPGPAPVLGPGPVPCPDPGPSDGCNAGVSFSRTSGSVRVSTTTSVVNGESRQVTSPGSSGRLNGFSKQGS